jgi:TM2 domain-containing membrane protein YozV
MNLFYKFILIFCIFNSVVPSASAILLLKPDTLIANIQAIDGSTPMVAPAKEELDNKKNQTIAFGLALVLGWIGIHDFYCEKMTLAAIKFVLGAMGLFFFFLIPPIGITLLLVAVAWALYDAYHIYNGEYEPEDGWDVRMKK